MTIWYRIMPSFEQPQQEVTDLTNLPHTTRATHQNKKSTRYSKANGITATKAQQKQSTGYGEGHNKAPLKGRALGLLIGESEGRNNRRGRNKKIINGLPSTRTTEA